MVSFLNIITACNPNAPDPLPYNATFVHENLKESFLYAEENRIDIPYENKDFDINDPESKMYTWDTTLPSYRAFVFTTESELDQAFDAIPDIDLNEKMLVVVLLCGDGFIVSEIKVENNVLNLKIMNSQSYITREIKLLKLLIEMDKKEIIDMKVSIVS